MPLVSIIVTTKNEEKNLARCLYSIKRQTFKNIEILVVDNHSTDRTKDIAFKFTTKVYNKGPERSAQRNFGIAQSRGLIVLYIDADMALSPTVIQECVDTFEKDPQVHGLYIPEKVVGRGFWVKVRQHERSFYDGTAIDAVRAIRRKTFDLIAGFDETICGVEDWDFDLRVRAFGKTDIIRAPLFHNEDGLKLGKYLQKKSYYGSSFATYKKKWGDDHPTLRKQFSPYYRYFRVFTENGKYTHLVRHPLLTCGMYLLRFFVGLHYLKTLKSEKHQEKKALEEKKASPEYPPHVDKDMDTRDSA